MRVAASDDLRPSGRLADACAHIAAVEAPGLRATRERMLAFAREHPDALDRRCAPGHFTGSALVLDAATARLLVLHHTKLARWLQPGGHADGDANLGAVAVREAAEETGITGLRVVLPALDLDIHRVHPPREPPHLHLDVRFLVLAPSGVPARGNHESTELRWVTVDELEALGCDAGLQRLASAGLAAIEGVVS